MQADRSIEFHIPQGCHYTTRLPRYGRDLKYDRRSAEALVPAVGVNEKGNGEVFRLNLEVGRYMRGYEIKVGGDDSNLLGGGALQGSIRVGSVNTAAIAEDSHNLLAFGTSIGTVEFWDSRSRSQAGILNYLHQSELMNERPEITALEFDKSGLGFATGSSDGLIHLYDLRSPVPLLKKDQGYGFPIQTLHFLSSSTKNRAQTSEPKILSADKRIIKIWDSQNGTPWTSIEPAVDINSVAWCKDTGMILTANEGRQQHSFFIPQLGPAPKWCSFLDNLVEEMAEDWNDPNNPGGIRNHTVGDVYDNFKFLTTKQLETLNLSHLVGTTSLLRPYMHGFFVAQRLYEEAKLISNPFVWEEERNKRVKEKINAERESRIRGNKKIEAKVNRRLAERMIDRAEKNEKRHAKRKLENDGGNEGDNVVYSRGAEAKKDSVGLLNDPRFAKLFNDENFAIDERSKEFQLLNPSSAPVLDNTMKKERQLTAVEEEAMSESSRSASNDSASYDDQPAAEKMDSGRVSSISYKRSGHRSQQYPVKQSLSKKTQHLRERSFGSMVERTKAIKRKENHIGGEREITFTPEQKNKNKRHEDVVQSGGKRNHDRRSASGNALRAS